MLTHDPALPSGIDYPVQLIGGPHGALDIGNFRIDESRIGVVPSSLEIASGDSATLLFKIDYDAPVGGLPIEVKTNVPDSVVMPEARACGKNSRRLCVGMTTETENSPVLNGFVMNRNPNFQISEDPYRNFEKFIPGS